MRRAFPEARGVAPRSGSRGRTRWARRAVVDEFEIDGMTTGDAVAEEVACDQTDFDELGVGRGRVGRRPLLIDGLFPSSDPGGKFLVITAHRFIRSSKVKCISNHSGPRLFKIPRNGDSDFSATLSDAAFSHDILRIIWRVPPILFR